MHRKTSHTAQRRRTSLYSRSRLYAFLHGYDKQCETMNASYFAKLFSILHFGKLFKSLRKKMQIQTEESTIVSFVRRFFTRLLYLPLRTHGLFWLAFSLLAAFVFIIKRFTFQMTELSLPQQIPILGCLLCSLILLFSPKIFLYAVYESRFLSTLLQIFCGISCDNTALAINATEEENENNAWAFFLGLLLGAFTIPFSSSQVLLAFGIGLLGCLILTYPECGVLLLLLLLPFLSTKWLVGLLAVSLLSYGIKLLRGKRFLHFEGYDHFVLLFGLILLFGGSISVTPGDSLHSSVIYFLFLLLYFPVVNLLHTREWLNRALRVLLCSVIITAVIGILQYYSGNVSTVWQDMHLFANLPGRATATLGNPNVLGEYLIATAFLPLALLHTRTRKMRVSGLVFFGLTVFCLVLTWSRGAWLGFALALLLYLLFISRHAWIPVLLCGAAMPILYFTLPQTVISRFLSIFNGTDSSVSARLSIWKSSVSLLKDVFISGIGWGNQVFSQYYTRFAISGTEYAIHSHSLVLQIPLTLGIAGTVVFVLILISFLRQFCTTRPYLHQSSYGMLWRLFIACFSGMTALLIQGLSDYIFYNVRIFCLFFLLLAFSSAIRRTFLTEQPDTEDGTQLSIDLYF